MKVLVAAIAMLLATGANEASADQAGTLTEPIATAPFYINEDGLMTVAVTIGGRGPYNFIIDTGATVTLAFDNLATIEKFTPSGGEPRRVLGISGSATLTPYKMGDIAVGAASLRDHVGVILTDWAPPRQTPHGVLGIDFFRQYAVVFDMDAGMMRLYPHGALPLDVSKKWRKVKLTPQSFSDISGELYTTDAKLNGSAMTFIIDLGSVSSLVNYAAAEAIFAGGITMGTSRTRTTGSRLTDAFDDRTKTRTGRFDKIAIGPLIWRKQVVWLKDAPIFDELGVADEPYGLLGLDLLAGADFALDFGENRLYVSR